MATASDLRERARMVVGSEKYFKCQLEAYWVAGTIDGELEGPEEASEKPQLHELLPNEELFVTLSGLILKLQTNSIEFASNAINKDRARLEAGPSDQDLQLMIANEYAIRQFSFVARKLAEVTTLHLAKLPQIGVELYLQMRLLHLGYANLACLKEIIRVLELSSGTATGFEALVLDLLSYQDEVNILQTETEEAEHDQAAERLAHAEGKLQCAKRALEAAKVLIQGFENSAELQLGGTIEDIVRAEKKCWELHTHKNVGFGERSLSSWLLLKILILADSAADLGDRLQKKLRRSGEDGELPADTVAAIGDFVACESQYHFYCERGNKQAAGCTKLQLLLGLSPNPEGLPSGVLGVGAGTAKEERRLKAAHLLVQERTARDLISAIYDLVEDELEEELEVNEHDTLRLQHMNAHHLETLIELHVRLGDLSKKFAERVLGIDEGKMLFELGPSENDIRIMKANVAALSSILATVQKHSDYFALHLLQLPRMAREVGTQGAAEHLSKRLLFVSAFNRECLLSILKAQVEVCGGSVGNGDEPTPESLLGKLEADTEALTTELQALKRERKELIELEEVKNADAKEVVPPKKARKEAEDIAEGAQSENTAQEQLKLVEKRIKKAEMKITSLTDALRLGREYYDSSKDLLEEAAQISRDLIVERPREIAFGDRAISSFVVQEQMLGSESACDLGVRLAEAVGTAEEKEQGGLPAECVAAICNHILGMYQNHELLSGWQVNEADIEKAIGESMNNKAD